ncbi:hypothetical protein KO465_05155 [Candidatus Micrarchaeota archaeon]|jgi:cell division GTPase FtsZ|nr:hypothetical protein [Candidatus Micrarchaeota archaeon]
MNENILNDVVIVGVGGVGLNTINDLVNKETDFVPWYSSELGMRMIVFDTNACHIAMLNNKIERLMIGRKITRGVGAGGYPEYGRGAAEENLEDIREKLKKKKLVLMIAGLGGGTGTGAGPIIAQIAKEQGAKVVAVVTHPLSLEPVRQIKASCGFCDFLENCDAVVSIELDMIGMLLKMDTLKTRKNLTSQMKKIEKPGPKWFIRADQLIRDVVMDIVKNKVNIKKAMKLEGQCAIGKEGWLSVMSLENFQTKIALSEGVGIVAQTETMRMLNK